MSLSDRIRPNSEASPWVIEEVKKLEDKISKAIKILEVNEQGWVCEECDSFDFAQSALQVLRGDLE
jgi:hypothetical protein